MSQTKVQNIILYVLDIMSILVSYIIAGYSWAVLYKHSEDTSVMKYLLLNDLGSVLIAYALVILFFNANRNFLKRNLFDEFRSTIKINLMFGAILTVIVFLKKEDDILPRGIYLLVLLLNVLFMFGTHSIFKTILKKASMHVKKRSVYVFTLLEEAKELIERIESNSEWGKEIKGIIISNKNCKGEKIGKYTVVANMSDAVDIIKKDTSDEVLFNIAYSRRESIRPIVQELTNLGIECYINVDKLVKNKRIGSQIENYANVPVLTYASVFHDDNQLIIKRLFDILAAIVGLIITGIVTIFLAPILKITSPGPLIFKQKRVGINGRYFYIYKFRSMYVDAEERLAELKAQNEMDDDFMFKMKDDPRITPVGKFIRKTSIDELPQFINVLKGDMSLIGTRPPTVAEFKAYEGHHKRRLSMKPGITGLWQVSGRSDITDFEEIVRLDTKYIDNWSFGLDIKIFFKTIKVILFREGAR